MIFIELFANAKSLRSSQMIFIELFRKWLSLRSSQMQNHFAIPTNFSMAHIKLGWFIYLNFRKFALCFFRPIVKLEISIARNHWIVCVIDLFYPMFYSRMRPRAGNVASRKRKKIWEFRNFLSKLQTEIFVATEKFWIG